MSTSSPIVNAYVVVKVWILEGVKIFFPNTQGRIELLKSGTQLLYRYKDAQAAT